MIRRPVQFLARHWPCAAAAGLLILAVAALTAVVVRRCGGHFVYPLDDTYIHMAVARTLARHGVWGLTPFGFTSCSSSILWPLTLALAWLAAGVREFMPLLLNLIFAVLLLAQIWALHRRLGHPAWWGFLSLIVVMALTPLPAMVMLGMEHVPHALLTVAFAAAVARVLGRADEMDPADGKGEWAVWVLAPLLAAVRYESGFVLAAGCFLLLCRRRWLFAAGLGLWGLAPLAVFGAIARAHGWAILPNSVLIKSGLAGPTIDVPPLNGMSIVGYMVNHQHLLVPLILTLGAVIVRVQVTKNPWEVATAFGFLYILAFFPLYLTLRSSLFGRYDAFLDCFGVTALMVNLPGAAAALSRTKDKGQRTKEADGAVRGPRKNGIVSSPWFVPVILALSLPLLGPMAWRFTTRAYYCTAMVGPGSRNIYEQQYQMGRFVKAYYAGRAVAVNDIGAVSYYGDIDCFDLYGLGSLEVLRARMERRYTPETLARLAAGYNVAVGLFYEHWLDDIPEGWKRAGQWQITDGCVCGGDTVSFYAVGPGELEGLKKHLREFRDKLPARVIQSGEYMRN